MNRINIKTIWHDPVWSKVIAGGLLFLFSQVAILIWGWINLLNFKSAYQHIFTLLINSYSIAGWIILLGAISFLSLILILIKKIIQKQEKGTLDAVLSEQTEISQAKSKPKMPKQSEPLVITEPPTIFFDRRFCEAFPGIEQGYQWFTKQRDIQHRLSILLASPTKFDNNVGYGTTTDPIWWYRGGSAMFIRKFAILGRKKILINIDEYIVEKIAAKKGRSYYDHFVYLQCSADKPTGLYPISKESIEKYNEEIGHYFEEYGINKGKLITRQEFDDGSAIIHGKPIKTSGAELRSRSLVKYNFIITSKFSPFNNDEFHNESEPYFIKLLKDEISFDEFVSWMGKFRKNTYDN